MDLLSFIPGGQLTAMGAAVVAALIAIWRFWAKASASGAAKERARQAGRDAKAKDERLEMHRDADAAEREAARLSDAEARRKAMEWARKN